MPSIFAFSPFITNILYEKDTLLITCSVTLLFDKAQTKSGNFHLIHRGLVPQAFECQEGKQTGGNGIMLRTEPGEHYRAL